MHRGAEDEAVAALRLLKRLVDRIVPEDAAMIAPARAAAAADAAADRAGADMENLRLDTLSAQSGGNLLKRAGRAALRVRTAVDQ